MQLAVGSRSGAWAPLCIGKQQPEAVASRQRYSIRAPFPDYCTWKICDSCVFRNKKNFKNNNKKKHMGQYSANTSK